MSKTISITVSEDATLFGAAGAPPGRARRFPSWWGRMLEESRTASYQGAYAPWERWRSQFRDSSLAARQAVSLLAANHFLTGRGSESMLRRSTETTGG